MHVTMYGIRHIDPPLQKMNAVGLKDGSYAQKGVELPKSLFSPTFECRMCNQQESDWPENASGLNPHQYDYRKMSLRSHSKRRSDKGASKRRRDCSRVLLCRNKVKNRGNGIRRWLVAVPSCSLHVREFCHTPLLRPCPNTVL